MSSGLPLSLAAVAGLAGLGLAARRGSAAHQSTLVESVDDLLVNPNLDAICDLAVLLDRYPNPTKPERALIRKNAAAMSSIREGEPGVVIDVMTEAGIPWQRAGHAGRGLADGDPWVETVPDGWVRDAVESADAAIASCRGALATSGQEAAILGLRDAAANRDRATCDRLAGYWDPGARNPVRPYLAPGVAHAFHAALAAARVFRAASVGKGAAGSATESAIGVAWHHAGSAAAHARPNIGAAARMDDRVRCGRRLVLRAILAAHPGRGSSGTRRAQRSRPSRRRFKPLVQDKIPGRDPAALEIDPAPLGIRGGRAVPAGVRTQHERARRERLECRLVELRADAAPPQVRLRELHLADARDLLAERRVRLP